MSFKPLYGYPPIVKKEELDINKETLESRGFSATNIIDISDILNRKKKKGSFIILESDDEYGIESEDAEMNSLITNKPHAYNKITYNPKK